MYMLGSSFFFMYMNILMLTLGTDVKMQDLEVNL